MTGPTLTITLDQAAVLFDSAAESRNRGDAGQAALLVLARFLDEHRLGSRMTCPPRYRAVEHAELTWVARNED